jgi:PEGA domain-containing protein
VAIAATVRTERRSRVPVVALAVVVLAAVSLAAFLGLRGRSAAVASGTVDTTTNAQIAETTTATAQSTAAAVPRDIPETTGTPRPQDTSHEPSPLRATPTRAERPAPPAAAIGGDGYLEIDSDPTAELFLDGVDMGPTPLFHHRVSSGQHALRLEASGYTTQRVAVRVEPGRTFTKTYKLNPE